MGGGSGFIRGTTKLLRGWVGEGQWIEVYTAGALIRSKLGDCASDGVGSRSKLGSGSGSGEVSWWVSSGRAEEEEKWFVCSRFVSVCFWLLF